MASFGSTVHSPWIAIAVIALWFVVGSVVAAWLTEKSFTKETIGTLIVSNARMEKYMGMS
ncbi:hypothetical protein [Trueperella bialowiezensis]|uniref:hypothetical protein n=1 Tax=Trueperella bialowiezensis TaxID=312285 RepID=UPI000F835C8D|nr:hypothetical protein [Trueperella bialowiezensis]